MFIYWFIWCHTCIAPYTNIYIFIHLQIILFMNLFFIKFCMSRNTRHSERLFIQQFLRENYTISWFYECVFIDCRFVIECQLIFIIIQTRVHSLCLQQTNIMLFICLVIPWASNISRHLQSHWNGSDFQWNAKSNRLHSKHTKSVYSIRLTTSQLTLQLQHMADVQPARIH